MTRKSNITLKFFLVSFLCRAEIRIKSSTKIRLNNIRTRDVQLREAKLRGGGGTTAVYTKFYCSNTRVYLEGRTYVRHMCSATI